MMNFKQWQVINENYGRFALGVKTPRSIGAVGSKLAEMGLKPDDMADDLSGDPMSGMDDMGGIDDMGMDPAMGGMDDMGGGGMDDMGMDPAMGGMDDDMGMDPAMGGMDDDMGTGSGGKITIDDLDPTLLALLGLHPSQPSGRAAHKSFGGQDAGEEGIEGDDSFGDEEGIEGDDSFGDEEGIEGDDEGNPFGTEGDDDGDEEAEDDGEEAGIPFGGKSSGSDGETDDDVSDEVEDDDSDETPEPKDKKKCSSGKNTQTQYSKKFMGKGMRPSNEDVAFLNGLVKMGRGNVRQKFESGMPQTQKRRLVPRAGEIGYAPVTRLGNW
jgi:hypothetical protein